MKASLIFSSLILGLIASSEAEQENKGTSPDGTILFEARSIGQNLPSGAEREIWLSQKDPVKWVSLCETPGWGSLELHFSPNNDWLIVQDGGGSLGIDVRLFHRKQGVHFIEQKLTLGDNAEHLALEQNGIKESVLDHRYLRVLDWTADSRFIFLQLSGHGSHGLRIPGWFAIYEVATGKFSFDLNAVNVGAVEKPTVK